MREQQMLINGEWVTSKKSEWLKVINPATEEVFARVSVASLEDVEKACEAAQKAFFSWSKLSPAKRASYLYKTSNIVLQRSSDIERQKVRLKNQPMLFVILQRRFKEYTVM